MNLILDCYAPAFQFCIPYDSLKTQMPFNYDIDYVKVWQQRQDCSSQTFTNTNETIYNSKVYKNVSITGTSLFDAGISHLCGQEYVLLDAGTEISGTAEVIIDTRNCLPYQVISNYVSGEFPLDINSSTILKQQIQNVKALPRSTE